MAEGILRSLRDDIEVFSAGTEPGNVNSFAIAAMDKIGVDIRSHKSESVDDFLDSPIDYVVTVCDSAREICPFFPAGVKNIYMSFPDPSAVKGSDLEKLEAFVTIGNQIKAWIESDLVPQLQKSQ